MVLRVTPQHFSNNTVRYAQSHNANLQVLQSQISTGLRVAKPSDDPAVVATLLSNKAVISRIEIDTSNIEIARSKLNQSVAQLLSAKEAVSRANTLALQAPQSDVTERQTLAREVDGVLQLILEIANSSDGGKPLYGGTSKALSPFVVTAHDSEGRVDEVSYQGSDERSRIVVGVQRTVDAIYSGEEVFMARNRGETVFVGDTGVQSGTGTDNGIGFANLIVRQTGTTYSGGSGLQLGLSSSNDTIIGDYTLHVDAVNQTLQLEDGPEVSFTPGDMNLQLRAENGALLHVDTSALTPGYVGDIVVSGSGVLSTDGGLTEIAIDFSSNQVVTNSETGEVTNVDTTAVRLAGKEEVEYIGTTNVFQVLIDLRNELLNRRDLDGTEWQDALSRRIGEVQRVHDQILEVIGEQSVALENLDGLQERAEEYKLETQNAVAALESVDVADAIVKMQTEQNALQFTYAVSVQVMATSILDFLR